MKYKKCFFLAALLAAAILTAQSLRQRYVLLDGVLYPRDLCVLTLPEGVRDSSGLRRFPHLRWLDLRGTGMEPEQFRSIAETVPQCRILWQLSFHGGCIDPCARELTVEHLTDDDVPALDSMKNLRYVEAAACRDYPQLLRLIDRRPECRVHYTVPIGEDSYDCGMCSLAPGQCSLQELEFSLPLLPEVQAVDLRQTGLTQADAIRAATEFPSIRFLWDAELGGVRFATDEKVIDLSDIPMEDTGDVEALIPFLSEAEKIIMCDCGISNEEMADLNERYPDIRFVWRVKLGPLSARTDDTWFAPITKRQLIGGHDADALKYCTDMECIDLGHCWIHDCKWAENMKNLRYLVLADSYVTDLTPLSGLKNLTYLELFVTPVRDYSPLLDCTGLEDLNLGYTYGDPAPISRMHWLKNLWWGGIHHVPRYGGQDPASLLRENLTDTRVVLYAGSSTGLGWRTLPHYYEMRDRIGMYYMSG